MGCRPCEGAPFERKGGGGGRHNRRQAHAGHDELDGNGGVPGLGDASGGGRGGCVGDDNPDGVHAWTSQALLSGGLNHHVARGKAGRVARKHEGVGEEVRGAPGEDGFVVGGLRVGILEERSLDRAKAAGNRGKADAAMHARKAGRTAQLADVKRDLQSVGLLVETALQNPDATSPSNFDAEDNSAGLEVRSPEGCSENFGKRLRVRQKSSLVSRISSQPKAEVARKNEVAVAIAILKGIRNFRIGKRLTWR